MKLLKKKENKNKSDKDITKIASSQIALENSTPRLPRPYNFGDIKTHLHLSIDRAKYLCTGTETLNGYTSNIN